MLWQCIYWFKKQNKKYKKLHKEQAFIMANECQSMKEFSKQKKKKKLFGNSVNYHALYSVREILTCCSSAVT